MFPVSKSSLRAIGACGSHEKSIHFGHIHLGAWIEEIESLSKEGIQLWRYLLTVILSGVFVHRTLPSDLLAMTYT